MKVAILALLLAGCVSIPPEPVIRTVETKVQVSVPCAVKLPADPEKPTKGAPAKDVFVAMQRALAELAYWEAWAIEAKAASKGCEKP